MKNLIVILIIALIIFLAIRYIYKSKKNGAKCVGCPHCSSCNKNKCSGI